LRVWEAKSEPRTKNQEPGTRNQEPEPKSKISEGSYMIKQKKSPYRANMEVIFYAVF